jgi:hypothetical protein
MVSKRESLSNRRDRYVVRLLRQFFAASLLSCRDLDKPKPMRPVLRGIAPKSLLEIRTAPSSVGARKSWRCTEKRREPSDYEDIPTRSRWLAMPIVGIEPIWAKRYTNSDDFQLFDPITSSALVRIVGGIVKPSVFAVSRFTVRSNLRGGSTGTAPGFAPLRIRSTKPVARRNRSP